MSKKINRAMIHGILMTRGENIRSVSSEAVDWVISVAEEAAKQLAKSGRKTPRGRLKAPKMDAGLMVRHLTKAPEEIAGVELGQEDPAELRRVQARAQMQSDTVWSPYNDWQTAVKRGETKLKFEEWKEQRK